MLKRILLVISCCTFFGLVPSVQAADDTAAVTAVAEKFRVLMVDPEEAKLNALLFDELSSSRLFGCLDWPNRSDWSPSRLNLRWVSSHFSALAS